MKGCQSKKNKVRANRCVTVTDAQVLVFGAQQSERVDDIEADQSSLGSGFYISTTKWATSATGWERDQR